MGRSSGLRYWFSEFEFILLLIYDLNDGDDDDND